MTQNPSDDIWKDDLLGFEARGEAFTNLVTSIEDHRTISIEAGYGRGKTFFRQRWARQLEAVGECVVQIDARLSDHSGDPVVTFLGALLALVPEKETKKREAVYSAGKKILVAGGKALGKAAMREGFDELAGAVSPEEGEASSLFDIAEAAGQDLSKAAGELIASQLSAEKARLELNAQLKILHKQITEGRDTDRIIILIDELDRCHPDYAIALLEAMKLVFDQVGFIFVLMVNSDYLERVAAHRFGELGKGEYYLDKFVNLRLKLEAERESLSAAVKVLASTLPLAIPYGDHSEFKVARAAQLAGELAPELQLSMRQIKRALERVELALRIYKDSPIDCALLVWLAFEDASGGGLNKQLLPRVQLALPFLISKSEGDALNQVAPFEDSPNTFSLGASSINQFTELEFLVPEIFQNYSNRNLAIRTLTSVNCATIYEHLAPHYIPDHQAMLDAVHKLQVDP